MVKRKSIVGLFFIAIGLMPAMAFGFQVTAASEVQPSEARSNVESDSVGSVKLESDDTGVSVKIDGELFTRFDSKTFDKPILYPIHAPGQIAMTRDWPMKKDTDGESHDHPHHKSMWISHEINGVDFWTEKGGSVKTQAIETEFADESEESAGALRASSLWVSKGDEKSVLSDQTTYWFGGDRNSRWINCLVEYRASHGELEFEDTKEGLFAIRTHPDLRLKANPKRGVEKVFGKAINSQGVTGKEIWGKPAKWLLYYGPVGGKPVSIAMYDHPSNLRHPTTWHARDYGLVTANPFGMHHFLGKKKGEGAFKVKDGGTLELRYRVEFFNGVVTPGAVEEKFKAFGKQSLAKLKAKQK